MWVQVLVDGPDKIVPTDGGPPIHSILFWNVDQSCGGSQLGNSYDVSFVVKDS